MLFSCFFQIFQTFILKTYCHTRLLLVIVYLFSNFLPSKFVNYWTWFSVSLFVSPANVWVYSISLWGTVLSLDSFIIKITFWSVFLLHSSLKWCNSRHIWHVSENWTCLTTIVSISPSILAKRPTKPFSSYISHFFWCVLFIFLKFFDKQIRWLLQLFYILIALNLILCVPASLLIIYTSFRHFCVICC